MYDALSAAMQWYVAAPDRRHALAIRNGDPLINDRSVYTILVRSGVLDGSFDFDAFDLLLERALGEEITAYDHRELLSGVDSVLTQLGVMPFDEAALPPEDPATY